MNWDPYFYNICIAVAAKSSCFSRNIGALLVYDRYIVSTGYNGPPRGVPHCGLDRYAKDLSLETKLLNATTEEISKICPRRLMNLPSGEGMELCPAQHAEENAVSNAARHGVSVRGCTLYLNTVIPCKNCFGTLINAGIIEIVCIDPVVYDKYTRYLIDNSTIAIRKFNLE